MDKYKLVREFSVLDTENYLDTEDFCHAIKEARSLGYYVGGSPLLEDATAIFGKEFLLKYNLIEEVKKKKKYSLKVKGGILGEKAIAIYVVDEDGNQVQGSYLIGFKPDGSVITYGSVNSIIEKHTSLKFTENHQLKIER